MFGIPGIRGVGWGALAVNICEKNHESVWGRDVGEYTYIVAGQPRCVIVRRLKSHPGK